MNCHTGACVDPGGYRSRRKFAETLSFCDMGSTAGRVPSSESSKGSESSPSSPSSPASLERPAMDIEARVERLGEIMAKCGKVAEEIIYAYLGSDEMKQKQMQTWTAFTIALFRELVGIKCITECPAMLSRLISVKTGDEPNIIDHINKFFQE